MYAGILLYLLKRAKMRENILETSRLVLKIKGIHKTTMRDIAKELEVSDGHVRYYFRTKEDLLVGLFHQMNKDILSLSVISNGLREDLRQNLQQSFRIMTAYDFFFLESVQALKLFPELFKAYANLFQQRQMFFREFFRELKQKGIFRPEVSDQQLDLLYQQFFILSDSWMRSHYLLHTETITDTDIVHYSELCLQLFDPYFSEI